MSSMRYKGLPFIKLTGTNRAYFVSLVLNWMDEQITVMDKNTNTNKHKE